MHKPNWIAYWTNMETNTYRIYSIVGCGLYFFSFCAA